MKKIFLPLTILILLCSPAHAIFVGDLQGNADTATALSANGANCSSGNAPLGVDASGASEGCFDVWTEAENTSAGYIANVSEDSTPQLGGDLDAQGNNFTEVGNLTYKTGILGGTMRTGTSASDKFQVQAYDVDGGAYVTLMEADAGNDPIMQLFTDYFHFENSADPTKILDIDLVNATTGTTTDFNIASTANRVLTFPDATTTLVGDDTTQTLTNKTINTASNTITVVESDISDLSHTATAITDGLIVEADLNEDSGTPTDRDILTYDSTGANFNWESGSSLCESITGSADLCDGSDDGGGGSSLSTEVDGVEQASATATYDFDGTDFTLTESPANDFDITIPDDGHAHTTTSISGLVEADITDLSHTADEVGTLTTGDLCINDGSVVNCTVNLESELETALDSINVIVSTEIDTAAELNALTTDTDMVLDTDIGVTVEAFDVDILKADEAENITADHEIQDDTALSFGNDNDFEVMYDATDLVFIINDAVGNKMMSMTDIGTTGTMKITGELLAETFTAKQTTSAGYIRILEPLGDGSNYTQIQGVATANDLIWLLPSTNGTAGQVLEIASVNSNTLTLEWDDDGGATSSDTLNTFIATQGHSPTSNFPTLDTRNNHPVLDFDAATNETHYFSDILPQRYGGGGTSVCISYAMTSATSGDIDWDVAWERVGDQQQDIDSDGFAAVNSVDNTTVPGTSGNTDIVCVNFTDGADMDSVASGEYYRLIITRDAVSDTATGDAELVSVEVKEQ